MAFLSFDYDYDREKWNLSRGNVPPELKAQGVPHALWMHFWDYSQSVVERSSVRSIMKKKLRAECDTVNLSEPKKQERETEITKLDEQTKRDFECLQRQAERLFPNSKARVSTDSNSGKQFGLEIQLLHTSSTLHVVNLHYDETRASWNLSRDVLPTTLEKHGISMDDWTSIWDYGFGVNQRAKEREHLNQLHERELDLCQKSLSYMNSTRIASVDLNADSSHNSSANQIRQKTEKLRKAREANENNTKKGWQELQRRAAQRFEPYGVKVYLSHRDKDICCGLQFQCPDKKSTTSSSSSVIRKSASHIPTPSAIWLPTSSLVSSPAAREQPRPSAPSTRSWMTIPKPLSPEKPSVSDGSDADAFQHKLPEKENDPPKLEGTRKQKKTGTYQSGWGQPIVLTYVHDDVPSRIDIEVSAPLTPTSSADSFDDEDSHGYVVPPAPSDPPSSIGSCSSGSLLKIPKKLKRLRFGENKWHTFESTTYTKADRKKLWFTHDEREASRSKTKTLAQRVIDNRNSGGADNVVYMDSETEEEVCWRGLEHAKKGNLNLRQETRRAFVIKVLEKQRLLQLDSWTTRRGSVADPAMELRHYAERQSRHCRERAQKLAAQDAKDARAVYKESLRKTNLHQTYNNGRASSPLSVFSACSPQHSQSQLSSQYHHQFDLFHQNDIFQDYCRQMHLATKARMQQAVM